MRPTRAALTLTLAAAICIGLGVIFGRRELFLLAGVAIMSLVVATLYVPFAPLDLAVQRVTSPRVLRVGTQVNISLSLHNKSRRRTPVLKTIDRLEHHEGAAVHIAPIRSGETAVIKYEVPAKSRGRISFGPFDIVITDPFGLLKTQVRAAEEVTSIVRSNFVSLQTAHTSGGELIGDITSNQKISASGDEFVRLRPYVVGDEFRRVHWPASARTGELVVRENQDTKTGVMSVLLDLSSHRYSPAGFERAVSATLSAVRSGAASDDDLQYVTSMTAATKVESNAEVDAVDLQLAVIQPSNTGSLSSAISQLKMRSPSGGTLVLITGKTDDEVEKIVAGSTRAFGQTLVILCETTDSAPTFWHINNDGTTDISLGWSAALRG